MGKPVEFVAYINRWPLSLYRGFSRIDAAGYGYIVSDMMLQLNALVHGWTPLTAKKSSRKIGGNIFLGGDLY